MYYHFKSVADVNVSFGRFEKQLQAHSCKISLAYMLILHMLLFATAPLHELLLYQLRIDRLINLEDVILLN